MAKHHGVLIADPVRSRKARAPPMGGPGLLPGLAGRNAENRGHARGEGDAEGVERGRRREPERDADGPDREGADAGPNSGRYGSSQGDSHRAGPGGDDRGTPGNRECAWGRNGYRARYRAESRGLQNRAGAGQSGDRESTEEQGSTSSSYGVQRHACRRLTARCSNKVPALWYAAPDRMAFPTDSVGKLSPAPA